MLEIDDRQLQRLQQRLTAAPPKIERRTNGRTVQASRALLRIARQVVHRRSNRLADSLFVDGPYPSSGALEARVRSPLPYADEEAARGGDHDFPTRTIEHGQGELDRLARDLELIVIQETGAGAS